MNKLLPQDLVSAWLARRNAVVTALDSGTNNDSYTVEDGGSRYLLRVYRHAFDPDRIRYEHALLTRLSALDLPFAVPIPLTARSGDSLVAVAGGGAYAALFPFFPGTHPRSDDPAHGQTCGAALAELDAAMATIVLPAPATGLLGLDAFPAIHAQAPDPDELLATLALEGSERQRLAGILSALRARIPHLTAQLPRQIVHRDFDASNILMVGGRVTAVLDFEFARPDLRVLDLAQGLASFGVFQDPGGSYFPPFARGYLTRLPLTPAEIEAIPDLMLAARAISLLHRAARRRMGTATAENVLARAHALLRRADWVDRHGEALVAGLQR